VSDNQLAWAMIAAAVAAFCLVIADLIRRSRKRNYKGRRF
jgi:hypothetical protein